MRRYCNPECSKSPAILALLTAAGHRPMVIDYPRQRPDRRTQERLIAKLDAPPESLVRRAAGTDDVVLGPADVIAPFLDNPERQRRPLLESAERALIARPPEERVFELLDEAPPPTARS